MNELPQQLVNGLLLGSMYGLVAIGYTMVYGIVQLINFAHGEIFMVGGFGALTVYLYVLPDGTNIWVALPLMLLGGVIVAVLVAVGAERFAYRPLRTAPPPGTPHHRHRPLPRAPAGGVGLVPRGPLRHHVPADRRRPLRDRRRHHTDR
ncbi:hypothetical protein GCM10020295_63050 [Streptomyces cinereospinus]